jgi:diguanylate cyclase (GGDEF)-like protein
MSQENFKPKVAASLPTSRTSPAAPREAGAAGLWCRIRDAAATRTVFDSPVLANMAVLALWVLVWQLGRLVEYTEHASVWFPVAGLTFAVLLLEGAYLLPGLFGGCVLMTIWVGRKYGVALTDLQLVYAGMLFALAHIGSYALGARGLRMLVTRGTRELPLLVIGFLLIAAASSLLATATGVASLVFTGMMPIADASAALLPYWIGDMAGVIVLAPFFGAALVALNPAKTASLRATFNLNHQRASAQFKYKLLLTLTLLAASMWLAHVTRSPNSAFAIFFLVIPYMWIASTESAFCNVLSVTLGSVAIALLVHAFALKEFSMVYQFAINVIAANSLFALALPTLLADNIALRRIADTDSLTGAASRPHLEQRVRLDILRCRMQREALTVILFDIDHFKGINDGYGHAVGDRALKHACKIAQQSLRPTDILGRLGGDEFVALLPGIDRAAAGAIAERIRVQLANSVLADGLALTASFGIAEMAAGDTCETLMESADKALYKAKQDGRNRVA